MQETVGPTDVKPRERQGVEAEVLRRYGDGARQVEPGLCCPTEYDRRFLEILPPEILERDYGCGDPSAWVGEGETALDLGSGGGKICYILAQKVGPRGRVIGVDFNDAMLSLARKYRTWVADKLGYANVRFAKGRIQDLGLDLERAQAWLDANPIRNVEDLAAFDEECQRIREEEPLAANESVDVVVSNCVLNLVKPEDKKRLFGEIYRVLRRGGRAVISDIVCDEDPTETILNDSDLWSGCIAGAFREDRFLEMFEEAGFYGVEILARQKEPWQIVEGIEFRSLTVRAYKGKEGPCLERRQAVVYKGPWRKVIDDDGHVLARGQRMAVCDKTFRLMTDPKGPYSNQIQPIEPLIEVPLKEAGAFHCKGSELRHPRETKGAEYRENRAAGDSPCCSGPDCC